MASLSSLVKQLKRESDRVEKEFAGLNAALRAFAVEQLIVKDDIQK